MACAHSDDVTSRGYFSRDTPYGLGPSDRIDRAGVQLLEGQPLRSSREQNVEW